MGNTTLTGEVVKVEGVVPGVQAKGAGVGVPGDSGEEDEEERKKRAAEASQGAEDPDTEGAGKDARNGADDGSATAGHPVDVQRGDVVDEQRDLSLPGLIPLDFVRFYNSGYRLKGLPFGRSGWLHSFHRTIEFANPNDDQDRGYQVRTAKGTWAPLNELEPGRVHFFRGGQIEVIRRKDRIEVYSLKTRLTEVFSRLEEGEEVYWITEIQSAHGHRVQFAYQGTQLQAVYDTCGRTLGFTWDEHRRIVRAGIYVGEQEQRAIYYHYNETGELAAAQNSLGFSDQFEYDGQHRMVRTTLKNGVSFYYEYHAESGKCIRTWGDDAIHSYAFSRSDDGREVVVTGTNEPLTYVFDENGETIEERSIDGSINTQREYDSDQLLLWESNVAGEKTSYEYNDRGDCTAVTDPAGNTTRWVFQNDLLVKRVAPDGLETVFRHDGYRENYFDDRRAAGPSGYGTTSLEDGPQFPYVGTHLNLSAIHFPTGDSVSLDYDLQGRLIALRSPEGLLESYEYSERHDVVRITDGRGATWQFAHDPLGQPIQRVDPFGATTNVEYDALGQVLRVQLPDGSISSSTYDALGNVSQFTDPLGRQTVLTYAGTGVLTQQTAPDGSVWQFGYDTDERLRTIINPKAESYEFRYNRAGTIAEEKTFDGRTLEYTYDAAQRLAKITKPGEEYREFHYNPSGRVVAEHSNHGAQLYERDAVGRLIRASVEDGPETFTVELERDEFGRVIAEHQGEHTLRYSYDAANRRTSREVCEQLTEYQYDQLSGLSAVTHLGRKVDIRRDILGREVRRLGNGGKLAVDSAYDLMGRLVSQAAVGPDPTTKASSGGRYRPDDGVPPAAAEPKAGLTEAQENVAPPKPAGMDGWRILSERQYRYDQVGRPTSIQDRAWGTTLYKYDSLDQLRSAHRGRFSEVFEYDPTSSLTQALRHLDEQRVTAAEPDGEGENESDDSAARPWHVAPGNLLLQDDRFDYEIDSNHRRKARTNRATGERTEYTWDCRDRLRQVTRPDGVRIRFFYDAFGRRVRKDVHPALPDEAALKKFIEEELLPAQEAEDAKRRAEIDEFASPPANIGQDGKAVDGQVRQLAAAGEEGIAPPEPITDAIKDYEDPKKLKTYEVKYLWDGDQLAAEVHSKEGTRVHVHLPGTFVALLQVEQGEVFHVISDHLGTPKELIDEAGRVAWSAAHGAWNQIQEQWFDDAAPRGRLVSSPFRGLGQYYDAETQLSCTRYRYWEAGTGRWLSGDPLGIDGGSNMFGFDGLPTVEVDPLGLATNISCAMGKKIVEGEITPGTTREIRGGHSGRIVNNKNPKFAVEVLATNPNGTKQVRFYKDLGGGVLSKPKKSTLFPETWSDRKIMAAAKQVGDTPGTPPRPSDGTTFHKGVVDGVEVEVLKIGDNVTSVYPTGN